MISTFRLYGPEIGKPTAVVDAEVNGVSVNGEVQFTTINGNETFSISLDRLQTLSKNNLAYDLTNVEKNGPLWLAIEDVEKRYEKANSNNETFVAAMKRLFQNDN